MKRREFLTGALAAAGIVGSRRTWAQAREQMIYDVLVASL
jgi:hypothetical protein